MTAPGVSSVPCPTEMMKNKFQREYIYPDIDSDTKEPEISPKKKGKEDENDEKKRKGTKEEVEMDDNITHSTHIHSVCCVRLYT